MSLYHIQYMPPTASPDSMLLLARARLHEAPAVCVFVCTQQQVVYCSTTDVPLSEIPVLHSLVGGVPPDACLTLSLCPLGTKAVVLERCLMYAHRIATTGRVDFDFFKTLTLNSLLDLAATAASLSAQRLTTDVCTYLAPRIEQQLSESIRTRPSNVPLSVYALIVALNPSCHPSLVSHGLLDEDSTHDQNFRDLMATHAERVHSPAWFSIWIKGDEPGWPTSGAFDLPQYARCVSNILLLGRKLLLHEQIWLYTFVYRENHTRTKSVRACFESNIDLIAITLAKRCPGQSIEPQFNQMAAKLQKMFRYLESYSVPPGGLMDLATQRLRIHLPGV